MVDEGRGCDPGNTLNSNSCIPKSKLDRNLTFLKVRVRLVTAPKSNYSELTNGEAWMIDYHFFPIWNGGKELIIKRFVVKNLFIDPSR